MDPFLSLWAFLRPRAVVGLQGDAGRAPVLRWVVSFSAAVGVVPYCSAEPALRCVATGLYCVVVLVAAEALRQLALACKGLAVV